VRPGCCDSRTIGGGENQRIRFRWGPLDECHGARPGGKTRIAAELLKDALARGCSALFVVPAIDLIDQAVEDFNDEGIYCIGIMQAGHPGTDARQPLQVASVQTLMRRQLPRAAFVIIDEAHRWFDFYETWLTDPLWQSVPFVAFTATPWTRGLGKFYRAFIIATTTLELIQSKHLCDFHTP
jgi:DNA repair protein RadD